MIEIHAMYIACETGEEVYIAINVLIYEKIFCNISYNTGENCCK